MAGITVCGKRRHAAMQDEAPIEPEKKQKQFSSEANAYFAQMSIKIEEVNKLDVSKLPLRIGRDYVDYIKPEDMTDGIMSFKDDYEREGVALLVTASEKNQMGVTVRVLLDVMTIFQRHASSKNLWVSAYNIVGRKMMNAFEARHEKEVQHQHTLLCPGVSPCSVPISELRKVVQGEDPDFKIGTPPTPPKQDDGKMADE